ncbi:hypothetical protein niasHT_037984 [Heterodera trifolii]|uniref:Zinc finger CCCH domain-containing protein 14 n=1 Tax=Heterodera trifolii TaxID=157864 RepID=A0ABD2HMU3_9BILA
MVPHNSEFTRKLRAAVRAKIEEFGIDVDDELPDYVMIMVGNKKDKARMKSDLKLFLGEKTPDFVEWLFGFFQKVKNATTTSSASTQQQQPQKQSSTEWTTDKDKGGGEGKAAEKVSSMEEKPTKQDRRERTRESEKPSSDRAKAISSSSADSQQKRRPSHTKKRLPSPPPVHRDAFPPAKNPSPSRARSPPRNGKSGDAKRTPPRRTQPLPPKTHGERSISPAADRKSVVLPSKGPPALRSVVSVPVQFVPTTHPRVRAVARSPSPPPSPPLPSSSPLRLSVASPKVMLSGGVVPVETAAPKSHMKIVNQLDIAAVGTAKNGERRPREEQKPTGEEVMPRKQQQVIRTALSPPSRNDHQSDNKPTVDENAAKIPRRRVVFGGGSLIFQRAIQQQQQTAAVTTTTTASSATNTPQKTTQPKATVVVRPQIRMVTVSSPPAADTEEGEGQMTAIEPTAKRPTTQRRTFAVVSQQQQTGVSLFQRAIKETKRQRTEGEDAEGIGKRPKRISAEMLESTNIAFGRAENADGAARKRPRIETEEEKKHDEEGGGGEGSDERIEKEGTKGAEKRDKEKKQQKEEKQREEKEEGEEAEEEEEEVLTIDMSKKTRQKREIKRPPKFGLELVKEHISGGQTVRESRAEEEKKKGEEHVEKERQISPTPLTHHPKEAAAESVLQREAEAKQKCEDQRIIVVHAERESTETVERTTVHFKRNWTSHASALTTSAPIWDGRIEIDDMSSTDDEAEIDAVLADAQRLRKIALERELPPTAAMSRPLLYNPLDFSLSPESGLISPSDAALLPAVTYKQLMLLTGGGSGPSEKQQQQSNSVNGTSLGSPTVVGDDGLNTVSGTCTSSSASAEGAQPPLQQRPHATVAPTTTIQAAPATMIVQQQYQYHHQNPQLRPRSHPYSQGYVPPPVGHAYRYQVNRGSVSKVYTGGNKMQFAIQQQNVPLGDRESVKQRLHLLRERHRQKSQALQRHLEEQRLLLGQLQKTAPNAEMEQRKELLSQVRQMEAPIGQLKRELNEVSEQITKATKCDG